MKLLFKIALLPLGSVYSFTIHTTTPNHRNIHFQKNTLHRRIPNSITVSPFLPEKPSRSQFSNLFSSSSLPAPTSSTSKSTPNFEITDSTVNFDTTNNHQNTDTNTNTNHVKTNKNASNSENKSLLEMPWSEWQEWALHDNLPKYLITISGKSDDETNYYALWHTMVREVTELRGYDVAFVRKMHARSLKQQSKTASEWSPNMDSPQQQPQHQQEKQKQKQKQQGGGEGHPQITKTPGILPFLDQFQFEPNGGITGKVYGLAGIANGVTIQTPPISLASPYQKKQMSFTVSQGYIVLDLETEQETKDENEILAYELGIPLGAVEAEDDERYRILKTLANTISTTTSPSPLVAHHYSSTLQSAETSTSTSTVLQSAIEQMEETVNALDKTMAETDSSSTASMIVNVAGLTAFLLAGATIMNALHHHLTVNVFWV